MSKRHGRAAVLRSKLQVVNEKIACLSAREPWGGIYATFSLAAHLAKEAIEAAEEFSRLPGTNRDDIKPVLDFWYRTRDYNHVATLSVAGGNQSLAEALVTFRLLSKAGGQDVR